MHTCHLLGPPRSRLNVRDTLAQCSIGRDRITAKPECAAMIYRVVTWGARSPGLYHRDVPRQVLLECGVAHVEKRSQHAARHEDVVGIDDDLSQIIVARLFLRDSIFEVCPVNADCIFVRIVINIWTQNYESVVKVIALHRVDASDLVDSVGGVNPILLA